MLNISMKSERGGRERILNVASHPILHQMFHQTNKEV